MNDNVCILAIKNR